MGGVSQVLGPNGVFLCVSHGQPSYRLTYLQRPEFGWNVKVHTVQKPMMGMTVSLASDDKDNVHYIYVCMKGERRMARLSRVFQQHYKTFSLNELRVFSWHSCL